MILDTYFKELIFHFSDLRFYPSFLSSDLFPGQLLLL